MKLAIPQGLTRNVARQVFRAKKNSPHIFFAAGIVSVTTGAVLACKATLKLEEVLDDIKSEVDHVKTADVQVAGEPVSDTERNRVLGVKYARGSVRIARLYAPAIGFGVAGIGLLTGSHIQLVRRNSALTAAFTMVSKSYEDYRERVRGEIGEEKENDIHKALTPVQETVDGKKVLGKAYNPGGGSPYARVFDSNSIHWKNNAELNLMFLKCQQEYMNNRLRVYGVVLLNDVYEALGFDRTRAGALVGWVRNDDDDRCEGDGYISFNITDLGHPQFVSNWDPRILLDFNVDGVVYDKI